ncbi:tRNA (adenosine(37)-N6)-threonylcarbamoyltransferase complex ATPase subunit type 1 TsaE [Streptomyces iconiensis]|uniref:tRNA threonylcarbamoyladenosine biosynthesis protein TsaE n=2 Tax=Streptomyces iconiensis TaxID=1384038 RepID=A0ABT7A3L7_9ACTN|nr:tRNA (adenosine(37)-N6)-threonylcarbamoyltransferase complex ATPase subunit type 1 TsaE [Streptomyces iconiensis]MDJ1135920.1 tRNA (adenosine(37)-N6)-threonylcarbamoyltransferase complex ATPase subunit type 1 TsaE [Streptomyces iconiensis]
MVQPPQAPSTGVTVTVPSAERMRELGGRLAKLLRPGDLVMLTGELGAGKTTLTRGLGEGLDVRGAVTSPTFVIARVHPPLAEGPPLVHVDAYRLGGGLEEMEDLDLDVSLPDSVVVVEWGEGKVEELTEDRLHVVISRSLGEPGAGYTGDAAYGGDGANAGEGDAAYEDDVRTVTVTGVGERWVGEDLTALRA